MIAFTFSIGVFAQEKMDDKMNSKGQQIDIKKDHHDDGWQDGDANKRQGNKYGKRYDLKQWHNGNDGRNN